jgi:hypothetical protein
MILTITGHREIDNFDRFKTNLTGALLTPGVTALIQGCAAGVDLESAKIAIGLGVPVISAIPWTTFQPVREYRELYRWVLDHSEDCYVVTEADGYLGPWVYHRRNEWMVDEGDTVISWWDGRPGGGTYAAIQYTNKVNKRHVNLYDNETV